MLRPAEKRRYMISVSVYDTRANVEEIQRLFAEMLKYHTRQASAKVEARQVCECCDEPITWGYNEDPKFRGMCTDCAAPLHEAEAIPLSEETLRKLEDRDA